MERVAETAVRVSVLGPTRVGGQPLTARQRSLVAALVLHGDRGASPEELIDAVWGDHQPPTARQSLQNQVTRLRRAHGHDLIVSNAAGYRTTRPSDVDEFDSLATSALSHPAGDRAATHLVAALSLWGGVPYADLAEHHDAAVERARLEALHADGADHLAASRLVTGDARLAVIELVELTEADPFRERRWALLLAALHLNGRTAEVTAAFERARDRLAAGLGIPPSADLVRLHQRLEIGATRAEVMGALGLPPARTPHLGCDRAHRPTPRRGTCRVA